MTGSYLKPILQLFQNPVFPLGDALLRHAENEGKLIVAFALNGEPDALRGASPVREGEAGK